MNKKDTYYLIKVKKWSPVYKLRGALFERSRHEISEMLGLMHGASIREMDEKIYAVGLNMMMKATGNKTEEVKIMNEKDTKEELKKQGFDALASFMDDPGKEEIVENSKKDVAQQVGNGQLTEDDIVRLANAINQQARGKELFDEMAGGPTEYIEGEGRVPIAAGGDISDSGQKFGGEAVSGRYAQEQIADMERTLLLYNSGQGQMAKDNQHKRKK